MGIGIGRTWGLGAATAMLLAGAAGAADIGPIKWMAPESLAKGELIDAMTDHGGISKADSKRTLDGFTEGITSILRDHWTLEVRVNRWEASAIDDDSDGDSIPTDEVFGVFSVGDGGVTAGGCPVGGEVHFAPGNPLYEEAGTSGSNPLFEGKASIGENPLSQESGWVGSAEKIVSLDNGVGVLGKIEGYFAQGDEVWVRHAEGIVHRDIAARVAAVIVRDGKRYALAASTEDKREPAGLVLRGIEKSDIRRGMAVARIIPEADGRCENPEKMLGNDELVQAMAKFSRLPEDTAAAALQVILNVIADTVSGGGFVDLEGFGRFESATTIRAGIVDPCAGIPENCPPADGTVYPVIDWDVSLDAVGASRGEINLMMNELESLAKRAARTGRNPQTGKEIKIAAKNVVKFKAGAELAKKVN